MTNPRTWVGRFLALLVLLVATAGSAPAAGDKPESGLKKAEEGYAADVEGGKKGLPSFIDIKRYDLGIYTLIVFGLLFFILKRAAWGPFLEAMANREKTLQQIRDEALQARTEAAEMREQLRKELEKANEEVRAMIDAARADSLKLRERMQSEAKAEIQSERERLRREIETARDQALLEIWQKTVQLATLITTKVIERHLGEDDHRRLVDECLAQLQQDTSLASTGSRT